MNKITFTNKQYKTVGVQWIAGVWIPLRHSWRQLSTKPENPTVSYCQPLYAKLEQTLP